MFTKLITLCAILTTSALAQQPSLKDAFQGLFRVGAAVNQRQFEEKDPRAAGIIGAQFNTISPENVMKWEVIHPRVDAYNFGPADEYVAFGQKYQMFIVGHNLVWHSQVPRWVFQDDKGAPLTRDALLARMKEHITTVVTRYKGKIGGWDVVNEALNEDGTLRKSQWLNIIGEDYLVKAFQYAHEADPNCELYYNDYSIENEAKRKGAVDLIKNLQSAGVKVAAMGLQGHDSLDWPTLQQQEDTIDAFAALGVKIAISEFDVDVLPRAGRGNSADVSATSAGGANPYVNGLPDDIQQALARRYADLFAIFVKHAAVMSRVTFWGVTDGDSWKNDFPVRGRTNYPLLFDRDGKLKPAFHAVIQTARKK
ncbi:Endo-1,4-beta-xylanase A [Candidatus Sulfopaludibacter sp. SbA3]|nr:Endo-1,4-beta-xylanase A [Candidatus Sulfopaludibacter sp. SbA3]